jgi:hypothetical protein
MALLLAPVFPENLRWHFPTLSSRTTFHTENDTVDQYIKPHQHTHNKYRYLAQSWTLLHSSVHNSSGSRCRRLVLSHAAPAGRREVEAAWCCTKNALYSGHKISGLVVSGYSEFKWCSKDWSLGLVHCRLWKVVMLHQDLSLEVLK